MNIEKYRILITGGAGFIGANLVRKLVVNNSIHLFIKPSSNLWRIDDIKNNIKFYNEDLTNVTRLTKFVKKINPHIVYHLAAHGAYSFQTDPIKMMYTNLIGTSNLILALNDVNYRCFVNTGSSSEYGFKRKPMTETNMLVPNSFYAATKASTTAFCTMYAKSSKKPVITFRPFSVYGPYEDPRRLIPQVISNLINNKPITLTTTKARRDFIYVDDVIDGYLNIIDKINTSLYGEVFNIGTGIQFTNEEIVKSICSIMKINPKIIYNKSISRSWDSDYWVANIEKAKRLLQWQPKHTLIQGLKKTVQWYRDYDQRSKNYT